MAGTAVLPKGRKHGFFPLLLDPSPPHLPPLDFPDIHSLQPQLDCGDREITVSLDRCQLAGLGFGDKVIAYLRDRNCSTFLQREEQNLVSVSSPAQAHACGHVLEVRGVHSTTARVGSRAGGAPGRGCETVAKSRTSLGL